MARLLLTPYQLAYAVLSDSDAIEQLGSALPDDGQVLSSTITSSHYLSRYRSIKLTLTEIPHMRIEWTEETIPQTHNDYQAIRLVGVTDDEFERLEALLASEHFEVGGLPEYKVERVHGDVRLYRSYMKDADAPCALFLLDEEEDKDILFAGPECSFQTFLPTYSRLVIRSREQRIFGVPQASKARSRGIFNGAYLGVTPAGNSYLPVKHQKVMDELRALFTGDSRLTPGAGGTTLYPKLGSTAHAIFNPTRSKAMSKAKKEFFKLFKIEQSCPSRSVSGRNLCLGKPVQIAPDYLLHENPPGRERRNDFGALAFGLSKDFSKFERPRFHNKAPHYAERGVETLVASEEPVLLATANRWGWLGLAIIPVTLQSEPYDVTTRVSKRIVQWLSYLSDVHGKINLALCIPIYYDHATLEAVGNRNRAVPGVDPMTAEAIKKVPYMGHFLTDCLMTVKGQMKTMYKNPDNLQKVGSGHFLGTFSLSASALVVDSRGETSHRTYHRSRYHQSVGQVTCDGANYRMLLGPSGAVGDDNKLWQFTHPNCHPGIPKDVIPDWRDPYGEAVQRVATSKPRRLAI